MRQVVDDERLIEEAMKLAQRLAEGPTRALVATRLLLEESKHASYAAQFRRGIEVQSEIRQSAHALEGRSAFVESARRGSTAGRPAVFIYLPNLSDRVTTRSNRCCG